MLDKKGFQARAEALGFAVPKSRFLIRGGDDSVFDSLRFPCVLKPTTKDEAYGKQFAKAYRVERRDDAIALWRKMQIVIERAVIQEWIEGDDSDVYFCLQYRPPSGAPATSFCGRKTLQWPPLVGGTATCIPAPEEAAQLTAVTSDFFKKVGFVGLCSMEYKLDRVTGIFTMIEPTAGRTDYQEEIATLNGVNIPLAAYCDLSGTIMGDIVRPARTCGWRDPFGHHRALAAGAADPAERLLKGAPIRDVYFRLDDPMPFLDIKLAGLRRRLSPRMETIS
jgi:D-aspartate ligase